MLSASFISSILTILLMKQKSELACKCGTLDGLIAEVNALMNADTRASSSQLYRKAKDCISNTCERTGDVDACSKNASYPDIAPPLDPIPVRG